MTRDLLRDLAVISQLSFAAPNPHLDISCPQLPETTNPVHGHTPPGDPGADGVLGEAEMGSYVPCGQPEFRHGTSLGQEDVVTSFAMLPTTRRVP